MQLRPIRNEADYQQVFQYYMDTRGWTQHDLDACIGDRARSVDVLYRKFSLTLEMIRKLNRELGIPAEDITFDHKF